MSYRPVVAPNLTVGLPNVAKRKNWPSTKLTRLTWRRHLLKFVFSKKTTKKLPILAVCFDITDNFIESIIEKPTFHTATYCLFDYVSSGLLLQVFNNFLIFLLSQYHSLILAFLCLKFCIIFSKSRNSSVKLEFVHDIFSWNCTHCLFM